MTFIMSASSLVIVSRVHIYKVYFYINIHLKFTLQPFAYLHPMFTSPPF